MRMTKELPNGKTIRWFVYFCFIATGIGTMVLLALGVLAFLYLYNLIIL